MNVEEANDILRDLNPGRTYTNEDNEPEFYFKGKASYLYVSCFYDEDVDKELFMYYVNSSARTRSNKWIFETESHIIPLSEVHKEDIEDIISAYYIVYGTRE